MASPFLPSKNWPTSLLFSISQNIMLSLITDKNIEKIHEGQVRTFMVNDDFIPLNISENMRIVSFKKNALYAYSK